jgi:hypothetical protein
MSDRAVSLSAYDRGGFDAIMRIIAAAENISTATRPVDMTADYYQ